MSKQTVGLTEIRQLPPAIQLADNGSPIQTSAVTGLGSQRPHCPLHLARALIPPYCQCRRHS